MRFFTIFGLAALSPTLWAATLYVAPWGDDHGPASSDQPLATLSKGVTLAGPGDVIVLRDGVYGPEGMSKGFPVWITKPGTPTAWITLKAENKGGAILDCQNGSDGLHAGCDGYIYLHTGAAYWVLQDLVFQNGFSFGASSNSSPAAHDILVRGCRFEYIGQHPSDSTFGEAGFYTNAASWNFTFEGNVFHDIGRTGGAHMSNDHGLYLHSAGTSVINNVFYAPISGWAIQTADGFSGMIAHNTFAFQMQNSRGHVMLWGSNGSVTVRNNIFYNPPGSVAINFSSLSILAGCSIDHNLVVGGSIGVIRGCSADSNSGGNAAFVNTDAPPYDFHLRPESDAVDTGAPIDSITRDFDGVSRPQGTAYDLGAYEYRSGGLARNPAGNQRQNNPKAFSRNMPK